MGIAEITENGVRVRELRLLTHARKYGIERLRESCAIATIFALHNTGGRAVNVTPQYLESFSKRDRKLNGQAVTVLKNLARPEGGGTDVLVMNRLVDAQAIMQRRRTGDRTPPWFRQG